MRAPSLSPNLPSPVYHPFRLSLPPRSVGLGAGLSIQEFGEACRAILLDVCARVPPAAVSARRQPASRAAPLDALGRHPAMRSPPGAGRGGYRVGGSILSGACVAAASMAGAVPSSSAAAAAAAATTAPPTATTAARRRRRAAARCGPTRPSTGPQLGVRRPCRLQSWPAHVRRPCRCSAVVFARICSCRAHGSPVSCGACVCTRLHMCNRRSRLCVWASTVHE